SAYVEGQQGSRFQQQKEAHRLSDKEEAVVAAEEIRVLVLKHASSYAGNGVARRTFYPEINSHIARSPLL
ncbi:MAG: hypothetical protein M1351_01605, partial [Candidatus Thermoplasmatota archaeon]|nr:hypothetical protein [Candidatus Thermoplasmatota archaeon]